MRRKSWISVCLVIVFTLSMTGLGWASSRIQTERKTVYYREDLKIFVDGRETMFPVNPFIIDSGWIMVPIEFVSEELGAVATWDDVTSTFSVSTPSASPAFVTSTYTSPNGDTYTGTLKDGNRHGMGTYMWANGDQYEGEFRDGEMHGTGTYRWPNGDKFVGEYRNGRAEGLGVYQWTDGEIQAGIWANGVRITMNQPSADKGTPSITDSAQCNAIEASHKDAVARANRTIDEALAEEMRRYNKSVEEWADFFDQEMRRVKAQLAAAGMLGPGSTVAERMLGDVTTQKNNKMNELRKLHDAEVNWYESERLSLLQDLQRVRDQAVRKSGC